MAVAAWTQSNSYSLNAIVRASSNLYNGVFLNAQ